MPGQPIVGERVVGEQEIGDAAILFELIADEQARLHAERLAQVFVELGIEMRVGHEPGELAQLEPAGRKSLDEGTRTRIAQHAPHLLLEHGAIPQLAANRRVQQLFVGNAAPEEKRQLRREIDIVGIRCRLDAEDEARRREDPLEAALNAGVEAVLLGASRVVEVEKHLVSDSVIGTAIRTRRNRRKNLARTRLFVSNPAPAPRMLAPLRRPHRPDTLRSPCSACTRRARVGDWPGPYVERAANRDGLQRRITEIQLVGRAAESCLQRLQNAFRLPQSPDERDADVVRAGLHRHANLEARDPPSACSVPTRDRQACCPRNSPACVIPLASPPIGTASTARHRA